jgi:endonuclease YncB( thermonuclease family)
MQFLLTTINVLAATAAAFLSLPVDRSESVLVRAVIDGDTIDVDQYGRVRLLGVAIPPSVANAARDRLSGLVLHRWVRLETDGDATETRRRRVAYVVTGDGVCVNTVLVRDGLARVTARPPLARFDELTEAEAEAQRLEKGMWGYTRRPQPNKRRSSWPTSPSSTHRSARFANATSFITGSTTGRSGFSFSSSRPVR